MGWFSQCLMSSASGQKLFCELCSVLNFRWICRGESGLPILFLHHLGSSLPFRLLKQKYQRLGGSFFVLYFLIEGWLLYRIFRFSVIHQQESPKGSPKSPRSWNFVPSPPHPTLPAGRGAPVRVPWVIQLIPAGYLFYMWYCNRWLINNTPLLLSFGGCELQDQDRAGGWWTAVFSLCPQRAQGWAISLGSLS